jgi:type II secretory pathway pseudopilin PulG
MITVSIVGILASIAIPKFSNMVRKAQEARIKGNMGAIRSAISIYYSDMEGYFPSFDGACGGPCGGDWASSPFLDIALTTDGKYLAAIPQSGIPPYHDVTPLNPPEVDVGGPNSSDLSTFFSFSSALNNVDNTYMWLYFADPDQKGTWGKLIVNCTHTDSAGTYWTMY